MTAWLRLALVLACAFLLGWAGAGCGDDGEKIPATSPNDGEGTAKIRISRLDELPQHTYPISGRVADLFEESDRMGELCERVRERIEADLLRYEIDDATTLQRMYTTLQHIHSIRKKDREAIACLDRARAFEDGETLRLANGLITRAVVAARHETGEDFESPRFRKAFSAQLTDRLNLLPGESAVDLIQQGRGMIGIYSRNLLLGVVEAEIEPAVARTGELSGGQAARVIAVEFLFREVLPLKEEIIAAYQKMIDANKESKPDIWAARSVALTGEDGLPPVLVAVWDTGTDCSLFEGRLFENAGEKPDGTDGDGNGYVDDVHGIAYDIEGNPSSELLLPLGEAKSRLPRMLLYLKGLIDLQAAVDSPEAPVLSEIIAGLEPEDVGAFVDDLRLGGNYVRGTHAAGILAEGNPFVRLLVARTTIDRNAVPRPCTVELARRNAAGWRETVQYFEDHAVRVVNIGWSVRLQRVESSLEINGIGKNAAERREIAREAFALMKETLYAAIKETPNILYVCPAGNTNTDVEFEESIPSSFDLPNLLVVGAVDEAGEPAPFTNYGYMVEVYANGFEVESVIPGGDRMKMSGTTSASPNVANLAAKLLAVKPDQTPLEVIGVIRRGADLKEAGSSAFLLMNPKKSLELLEAGMTGN
jgi:hypothetical protein